MDVAFLDTNALLKLYLPEKGSNWLRNFINNKQITISELSLIEAATSLRRLYLEGAYTRIEAIDLITQIEQDSNRFDIIPVGGKPQRDRLTNIIFNLAGGLRIRALDALQIVAADFALTAANSLPQPGTFVFVSSDVQLLRVAQALNFTLENPEDYP